jgi:hypothetical protein
MRPADLAAVLLFVPWAIAAARTDDPVSPSATAPAPTDGEALATRGVEPPREPERPRGGTVLTLGSGAFVLEWLQDEKAGEATVHVSSAPPGTSLDSLVVSVTSVEGRREVAFRPSDAAGATWRSSELAWRSANARGVLRARVGDRDLEARVGPAAGPSEPGRASARGPR